MFQQAVPDEYRGRIYGAVGTSINLVGMASLWIAGTLGEIVGIAPALSLGCIDFIVAGFLGMVLLRERQAVRLVSVE
jgi:hypothetical protein